MVKWENNLIENKLQGFIEFKKKVQDEKKISREVLEEI